VDLGCGPGLYLKALGEMGHGVTGIDMGPASVEHARGIAPAGCEVRHGDLRTTDLGGPYDLALLLYGEGNVFSPTEIRDLLARVGVALRPGGTLLLEPHTVEAVEHIGSAPPSWHRAQDGLFADEPYLCLTESRWLEAEATAITWFHVIDEATAEVRTYRSTTKAWTAGEWRDMLTEAGFEGAQVAADWPPGTPDLELWVCRRPK
jgi:SAM-dependent methyltransferase